MSCSACPMWKVPVGTYIVPYGWGWYQGLRPVTPVSCPASLFNPQLLSNEAAAKSPKAVLIVRSFMFILFNDIANCNESLKGFLLMVFIFLPVLSGYGVRSLNMP